MSTPVMIRAQQLFSSRSITFVDTSASCDSNSSNVTLMLCPTKAGAVPLCVLLHEAQTTESYAKSFSLVKETFPNAFGGERVSKHFEVHFPWPGITNICTEQWTVGNPMQNFSVILEQCFKFCGVTYILFQHPTVFMTDNSSAEKTALEMTWLESKQLLCGFHVGQAVTRNSKSL